MDLLISMKAETINKGIHFKSNILCMPTAQSNGYFIAEFRETDEKKLNVINRFIEILEKKLDGNEELKIEDTPFGFKVKSRVDKNVEYMESWEEWVALSWMIYYELEEVIQDSVMKLTS